MRAAALLCLVAACLPTPEPTSAPDAGTPSASSSSFSSSRAAGVSSSTASSGGLPSSAASNPLESSSSSSSAATSGTAEVCNGLDDDQDGTADNHAPCGAVLQCVLVEAYFCGCITAADCREPQSTETAVACSAAGRCVCQGTPCAQDELCSQGACVAVR